jgi:hypothetical protein
LEDGKLIEFYESVQELLWNEAAHRFGVVPSKLNRQYVTEIMGKNGIPKARIEEYFKILEECEWALYAPGGAEANPHRVLIEAERLIASFK